MPVIFLNSHVLSFDIINPTIIVVILNKVKDLVKTWKSEILRIAQNDIIQVFIFASLLAAGFSLRLFQFFSLVSQAEACGYKDYLTAPAFTGYNNYTIMPLP
jgi:hypothetical protein